MKPCRPKPPSHQALRRGVELAASAGLLGCLAASLGLVGASAAAATGIYSCIDSTGKRLTSDRPIPECLDREQRVLNKDGSQRQTLPPRMNAEERALDEERQRQKALAAAAQKDAIRRDRNLMLRFPDEATHHKGREAAMDDLRKAIAASEKQVAMLKDERKPLLAETEFYKGKRLPAQLRTKLEANEAQQQAQQDIIENQKAEMIRINGLYDAELARLRKLWAGATPGTLAAPDASAPAASR
jgi:hypothetical protein